MLCAYLETMSDFFDFFCISERWTDLLRGTISRCYSKLCMFAYEIHRSERTRVHTYVCVYKCEERRASR